MHTRKHAHKWWTHTCCLKPSPNPLLLPLDTVAERVRAPDSKPAIASSNLQKGAQSAPSGCNLARGWKTWKAPGTKITRRPPVAISFSIFTCICVCTYVCACRPCATHDRSMKILFFSYFIIGRQNKPYLSYVKFAYIVKTAIKNRQIQI